MQHITLAIHMRWWLRAYLYGVTCMAYLMGAEPDWAKVERTIERGLVIRLAPVVFEVAA